MFGRSTMWALAAVGLLAVVYWFVDEATQHPLAVFVLPVLAVAALGSGRQTFAVGVVASCTAAILGVVGSLSASGFAARLVIVVACWALAVVTATARTRREERSAAGDARALRVNRALHVGRVGTWQWDRASGLVDWDDDLHALFGVTVGEFDGTFEGWVARLHPGDRSRVLAAVNEGVASAGAFRFDHRCVWPDGSVHWLHGVGEAIVEDRQVVGAAGLTLNIDERMRLLEVERTAAARAKFLERTNRALVESLDLDEVIERITHSAIDALAEWCSLVVTIDQPSDCPLIAVAHSDPDMVVWAKELQRQFPYDPNATSGVPQVLRTGDVEFVPVIDAQLLDSLDLPSELRDVVERLDLRSSITVPLVGGLGTLGALQLIRTSQQPPFTATDVALAQDLAGPISAALNTTVLFRRQQAAQAALRGLQEFTAQLADLSTTSAIADVVVRHAANFTHADKGLIYVTHPDQSLQLAAQVGYQPDELADWAELDPATRAPVADAVRTLEPVVLADRAQINTRYPYMSHAAVDDEAVVALPMFVAGRTVGGMFVTWRTPHVITDTEMSLLRTIAGRGAGALERAHLYETQRSIAVTLQRSLLPRQLTTPPWFTAAAQHWPGVAGTEVGGDFYDLFPLTPHRWALTIGDVCGHGIQAAAVTAVARHTARAAARHVPTPSDVLDSIHDALVDYDGTTYCTVCFMTLEHHDHRITAHLALGGHPPPLLRRTDGTIEPIGTPGTILGIIPPHTHTIRVPLDPGDLIVMYTDGVTDAPGPLAVSLDDIAQFITNTNNPADCLAAIADLLHQRRPRGVTDDTAILVIQLNPDPNI